MARPQPLKLSHVGSSPSPGTMEVANPDIFFMARYKPATGLAKAVSSEGPVVHWSSVYSDEEDAYRGAATFIRNCLLNSSLRTSENMQVIRKIEGCVRKGDVDSVITLWNENFQDNQVRVYKSTPLHSSIVQRQDTAL